MTYSAFTVAGGKLEDGIRVAVIVNGHPHRLIQLSPSRIRLRNFVPINMHGHNSPVLEKATVSWNRKKHCLIHSSHLKRNSGGSLVLCEAHRPEGVKVIKGSVRLVSECFYTDHGDTMVKTLFVMSPGSIVLACSGKDGDVIIITSTKKGLVEMLATNLPPRSKWRLRDLR